jgi:hypothetical protein
MLHTWESESLELTGCSPPTAPPRLIAQCARSIVSPIATNTDLACRHSRQSTSRLLRRARHFGRQRDAHMSSCNEPAAASTGHHVLVPFATAVHMQGSASISAPLWAETRVHHDRGAMISCSLSTNLNTRKHSGGTPVFPRREAVRPTQIVTTQGRPPGILIRLQQAPSPKCDEAQAENTSPFQVPHPLALPREDRHRDRPLSTPLRESWQGLKRRRLGASQSQC